MQLPGHHIGEKQEEEPGQDRDGLGAAQNQHHLVNDDGDQDDVDTILPAQIAEKIHHSGGEDESFPGMAGEGEAKFWNPAGHLQPYG